MREHNWAYTQPAVGATLAGEAVSVTVRAAPAITLVSGDITAFAARSQLPVFGLAHTIDSDDYLLRVARDRALWVSTAGNSLEGWHDGMALSPMRGGFAVLELKGEAALDLLAQGTSVDLRAPSPCAALLFAGHAATVARFPSSWWLLIEPALLSYFWQWFDGADT
ncbi:MAG: hypothetical protein AAF499_19420 [Pseudomonadota bacterium]